MRIRHRSTGPPSRRGLTLLELMIALAVAGSVFAALAKTADESRSLFQEQDLKQQLDLGLNRGANSVSRFLLAANSGSLLPDLTPIAGAPPPWTDALTYRAFDGFDGANVIWSADRQLRWEFDAGELGNDLDDDGDGLVDEGVLVWVHDEFGPEARRTVVASSVAELLAGELLNGVDDNGNGLVDESGAAFEFGNGVLTLHLTLERRQPGGPLVQRTRRVRVQLRN